MRDGKPYIKSTRIVEHTWVCGSCKMTNLARRMTCSKCGQPKAGESYDLGHKKTVTEAAVRREAMRGPNWTCTYCKYENRGDEDPCGKCGADRDGHKVRESSRDQIRGSTGLTEADVDRVRVLAGIEKDEKSVNKADLPPDVAEAFDKGVMSNDQMQVLLNATGHDTKTDWQRMSEKLRRPLAPLPEHGGGYRDAAPKPPTAAIPVTDLDEDPDVIIAKARARRERAPLFIGIAVVLGLAAIIALIVWIFTPWQEHTRVASAAWSRTTNLQQRVTRDGSGWGSPAGAFNVACETRQHGTHDCNPYDCHPHSVSYECRCHEVSAGESCHESCTHEGNGFSSCHEVCTPHYREECSTCSRTEYDTCYHQCPTYEQWCTYQYYEWPQIDTATTRGTDRDPVVWPALDVDPNAPSPQRLDRSETYTVTFNDPNGTWTDHPTSAAEFGRFHVGDPWVIEVDHAGDVRPLHRGVE